MGIVLVIFVFVLVLILVFSYSKRENFDTKNLDTSCLLKFPEEIDPNTKYPKTQKIFSTSKSCGKCKELESNIKSQALIFLKNPNNFPTLSKPENCELCNLLIQAWERYYFILKNILNYLNRKELPKKPEIKNSEYEKYSEEILDETLKKIKNKKYTAIDLPKIQNKNGWEEWTLYTLSLIHIGNYVECARFKHSKK